MFALATVGLVVVGIEVAFSAWRHGEVRAALVIAALSVALCVSYALGGR